MLSISGPTPARRPLRGLVITLAVGLLVGGLYVLSLVTAPAIIAPVLLQPPIAVTDLPNPSITEDRIVIPKLGVNITYAPGEAALNRGAQWRYPDRGNPATGGNFIIAAHRFSIQPTPQGTIEKSPFYRIDQLAMDDKIIVDYQGTRYAYKINKIFDATPNQTEIEAASDTDKLTLYSCELGGSEAGRIVVLAEPIGKVAVDAPEMVTN